MQVYSFQSEDGEVIDKLYEVDDRPSIGDLIEHEGKTYKRIFCGHIGSAQIARVTHQFPRVSESLPRNFEFGCDRDHKGRQIITGQNHEKEVIARASAYSRSIGEGDYVRDGI